MWEWRTQEETLKTAERTGVQRKEGWWDGTKEGRKDIVRDSRLNFLPREEISWKVIDSALFITSLLHALLSTLLLSIYLSLSLSLIYFAHSVLCAHVDSPTGIASHQHLSKLIMNYSGKSFLTQLSSRMKERARQGVSQGEKEKREREALVQRISSSERILLRFGWSRHLLFVRRESFLSLENLIQEK